MGFDLTLQSLPPTTTLLDRARLDQSLAEVLQFIPSFFERNYELGPRPWPEAQTLCTELRQLAALHPGLEKRHCTLDRHWDVLDYLLSPNRRQNSPPETHSLLDFAIRGQFEIGPDVRASQGTPIKFTPASSVQIIALLLQSLTEDDLRLHYQPQPMADAAVYKFYADRATPEHWQTTLHYVQTLRTFYMNAASHHELILHILD